MADAPRSERGGGNPVEVQILSPAPAEVVKWQTRRSQKPVGMSPCGFDSRLRHQQAPVA